MADDEASLRSQVSSKESEKANREQEKRAIEEKIRRLQEAEKKVKTEKATIRDLQDHVHKQRKPDSQWDGNLKNRYQDFVGDGFKQDYNNYYNSVDTLLDTIVRKIVSLQNEASDLTGIIGFLTRSINSLWGEIRTLFN